jgi:hypothetical protein
MKTLLLALVLLVTGSAWAEWVIVNSVEEANFYIDNASIRKDANLRKVWEVVDLKKGDQAGALSYQFRIEFECSQELLRVLYTSSHKGQMVGGGTLYSDPQIGPWREIPPGSTHELIFRIVCAL